MFALLFTLLTSPTTFAASPVDVDSHRLPLDAGYLEFEVKKNKLSVYVNDGEGTSFWCSEWGLKKRWESYEAFFRQVSTDAMSHPNADLGSAMTGMQAFSGSQATGYCNASAVTRSGTLIVIFSHNRACFGSAGCNTDRASFAIAPSDAAKIADSLYSFLR